MANRSQTHFGVGIDTARYGHHVTFLREDKQPAAASMIVMEGRADYQKLQEQLEQLQRKHHPLHFHVRIDAAGQYATNLEHFLRKLPLPMTISIGEPKRNKDYHKAMFPKRTTDATESRAMARFGVVEKPEATPPLPDEFYVLREVAGRLQGQVKDTTRAVNRLHNLLARVFPELATVVSDISAASVLQLLQKYPTPQRIARASLSALAQIPYLSREKASRIQAAARQSVGSLRGEIAESLVGQYAQQIHHCKSSEKQLEKLLLQAFRALPPSGHLQLETILGIGVTTAAVLVAKIISIDRFETSEKLVGYFGIFPEEDTSGVDRYGKPIPPGTMRMSRKGNDLVRCYLWNAAKSAINCNPAVRALYARLRARNVRGDVALGHCMRKLLHLVFAVWKTDKPFDENYYPWERNPKLPEQASSPEKTAAGHKRDVLPARKVVTAATVSVAPVSPAVKHDERTSSAGTIDYAWLREQVTMRQVLEHFGCWTQLRGKRNERRGPCPLHVPDRPDSRSFAVNVTKNVYRCLHPGCRQQGNVLDFWSAKTKLPLYDAALDLANTFHLDINPEQRRGARKSKRKPR